MARNRMLASVDDVLIACTAERATEKHGGSFDSALEEVLRAGFEAIKADETVTEALNKAAEPAAVQ